MQENQKWKNFKNLNKNSIGIELVNKGHKFGYQKFTKEQINSFIKLCKILKKKYSIKQENFIGHSDIAPLRKIDPGEKFPWKKLSTYKIGKWFRQNIKTPNFRKKEKNFIFFKNIHKLGYRYFSLTKRTVKDRKVIKCFQQHYSPDNITGKVDQKPLE